MLFLKHLILAVLGLCCHVGFSPVAVSGGHPLAVVRGSLIAEASLVGDHRLWGVQTSVSAVHGLSSCCFQAQQLWRMGLVAQPHVKSSWTRYQTRVSCIDRPVLYHWAIREASGTSVFKPKWRRKKSEKENGRVWPAVWRQSQGSVVVWTVTEAREREHGREVCWR